MANGRPTATAVDQASAKHVANQAVHELRQVGDVAKGITGNATLAATVAGELSALHASGIGDL